MSASESLFDNSITSNTSSQPINVNINDAIQNTSSSSQLETYSDNENSNNKEEGEEAENGKEEEDQHENYEEEEFDDNDELSESTITYRLLVSRRETGAIIGKEGSNISQIRDKYDIKAGVSKVIDGCIDRVLSISGKIDNVSLSLTDIAQSVTDANVQTIKDCELKGTNPLRLISYDYSPLKPLSNRPNYKSIEYENNLFLRLLIPNSQIGTLIGKNGNRIKSIQEKFNIKMVASKDFLENSNERLVEIQGNNKNDLQNAIRLISKFLLRDYQGNHSVTYYIPCSPIDHNNYNHNGNYNNRNSNNNNRRNNNSSHNYNNENTRVGGKEIIKKISFPNEYIGALIGKRGSRIQEIRIISQCAVAIENENDEDNEREITLVGTKYSVDKAIDLLNMYYEREQKRRMEE
ncbi:Hek2 protein [Pichia kluyveri]|uniref:Hek2 protein n=1 Tax=Pichia kluyveri TaxID=36015 RepID=A0AAV5R8R9_PICKL|nr:Hek2 protein [Pichia kluyveri]